MLSQTCYFYIKKGSVVFRFRISLLMVLITIWIPVSAQTAVLKQLPSLEETLQLARSHQSGKCRSSRENKNFLSEAELVYQVKKNYYRIQAKYEQLIISEEVKGHFNKAVAAAEEEFEKMDGEVTQSAITKLKLGLSGALNDLAQFENDKQLAQLRLGRLIGREIPDDIEMGERSLERLEFPCQTVAEYFAVRNSPAQPTFELKEAMIEINKARAKMNLALNNRKMTRALLVTEVANYDFGIGDEGDLFEALIIYTRVLVGYFEALYEFNLSVSAFERVHGGSSLLCHSAE